jgi:acetyl-CoA acetyltransferase
VGPDGSDHRGAGLVRMSALVADYDDVAGLAAVTGVGQSDHTGPSGRDAKDIAAQAIARAIADAGLTPGDIDGIMYKPFGGAEFTDDDYRRYFGTTQDMWVSQDGGGMRWVATAPYEAAIAIRDGKARHVLNSFAVAWATQRGSMVGGPGQSHAENLVKQNFEVPFGLFPQPIYAAVMARRHMIEYGTTERQLAAVAVTMREHANRTPEAVMHNRTMSVDDYLASPVIAEPLRKFDCCLISDGGGAFIVSGLDEAGDMPHPVVEVAGSALAFSESGHFWSLQREITRTAVADAAPVALKMAGLSPTDLDVVSIYDPFTIITLMVLEDLGICAKGEGGPFSEAGGLHYRNGSMPTNTHGGLHSHAYVLGIAHIVELVRQLRGDAAAQVQHAETGAYAASIGSEASTLVLRRAR